jgi:hypothetical protein
MTTTKAQYAATYEALAPTITRLSDSALVDSIHEAIARKVNKLIIAALVAEAMVRGIKLS